MKAKKAKAQTDSQQSYQGSKVPRPSTFAALEPTPLGQLQTDNESVVQAGAGAATRGEWRGRMEPTRR